MQKYPDLWGRTVPDIIDPENSTPKFGIIKDRVQDVKSRLQPRFDWRILLLIWSFMTIKVILLMSVTPERKSASPIGLALKEKKTAMWQEYLKKKLQTTILFICPPSVVRGVGRLLGKGSDLTSPLGSVLNQMYSEIPLATTLCRIYTHRYQLHSSSVRV